MSSSKKEDQAEGKEGDKALVGTSANVLELVVDGHKVELTWTDRVGQHIDAVRDESKSSAFHRWMRKMLQTPEFDLRSVHIRSVDMFGPRPGFIELEADSRVDPSRGAARGIGAMSGRKAHNKESQAAEDRHLLVRGGAVGILVVLTCEGEDYTVLTLQARIPAGRQDFPEIPAGMIDKGDFTGAASKELKEETGIVIHQDSLIDLTEAAFGDEFEMVPAPGSCDELIRLYLCQQYVTPHQLEQLRNKTTGEKAEGEVITLRVVPLADLWQIAPDGKSLSALIMYHRLKESGKLVRYPRKFLKIKDDN